MSADLNTLERLAKQHGAKVTLIFEGQTIRVTCKLPGMSAEVIEDHGDYISRGHNYPSHGADGVLRKVVERLGWRHAPTPARVFDLLTQAQRQRVVALLDEYRQIRDTVLHPSRCEPRLAAPRSGLHPAFVQGEPEASE
jgi:hypothetical protein